MGIERRQHPRIKTLDMVSYENYETNQTELMQGMGETVDISEGGVCFISTYALPLGSEIELSFALEDELFNTKGKIVSLNLTDDMRVNIHVEFTEMTEKNRETLQKYLS